MATTTHRGNTKERQAEGNGTKQTSEEKDTSEANGTHHKAAEGIPPYIRKWLNRLESVSEKGAGGWRARCPHPEHEDSRPSFNLGVGKLGRIVINCHACAPKKGDPAYSEKRKVWADEVLSALGLTHDDFNRPSGSGLSNAYRPPSSYVSEPICPLPTDRIAEIRNGAYQLLQELAGLTDKHRQQLEGRGLSAEAISKNGYFSLERLPDTAMSCLWNTPYIREAFDKIPGVAMSGISPSRGLFIPVRNDWRFIISAQVRPNGNAAGKYLWLTGSPPTPHVPLGVKPGEEVWVTEGILKADIATHLGCPCVGVPGVSNWRPLLPSLERWGTKRVVIAWDADRQRKPPVKKSLLEFAKELITRGVEVKCATWLEVAGNGIDDLLHNGGKPVVEPLVSSLDDEIQLTRTRSPIAMWNIMDTIENNSIENTLLSTAARVWLAIFRLAGGSSTARLVHEDIVKKTGFSLSTISRAIAELVEAKLLKVKPGNNITHAPSTYYLPDCLPA